MLQANFVDVISWQKFWLSFQHYHRMEIHAHETGGRLVVPRDHFYTLIGRQKTALSDQIDNFQRMLLLKLSNCFGVSIEVIEVRLDREELRSYALNRK